MRFEFQDLGTMDYSACHERQDQILEEVVSKGRRSVLLFVEHPPVLTLGAAFKPEHLFFPISTYEENGIEVIPTDRGGDVTFHGPNQLVAYPIFDLRLLGQDLHKWLRDLEEAVIRTLAHFGLEGYRFAPHTGVWVNGKKICAMGIKVRRWVSKHGIALNCSNDLTPFDRIVPCGIEGYGVTSLTKELSREVTVEETKPILRASFETVFGD